MLVSSSSLVFLWGSQPATVWLINVIVGLWFVLSSGCARFVCSSVSIFVLYAFIFVFPIIWKSLLIHLFIVSYANFEGAALCWTWHVWEDYRFYQVFPKSLLLLLLLFFEIVLKLYMLWTLKQPLLLGYMLYVPGFFYALKGEERNYLSPNM